MLLFESPGGRSVTVYPRPTAHCNRAGLKKPEGQMGKAVFEPLSTYEEFPAEEMRERAALFFRQMKRRRSVRHFSNRPVSRDIIEHCLLAAGTAPSGANLQPWHFATVSDPIVRKTIREAAEVEERAFY